MGFVEAVKTCFKKYITFSGRASRSEYWYFWLFNVLVGLILGVVDGVIEGVSSIEAPRDALSNIYMLATIVPSFAVWCRRLHDKDISGKWLFTLPLIFPIIPLYVLLFLKGTQGPNRYGPDPLQKEEIIFSEAA